MKLTKNFSLSEFEYSAKARELGIDNTLPTMLLRNVQCLAERLQLIRDALNAPLTISSGYRCAALNKVVSKSRTSQHQLGLAADIHTPNMTAQRLFDFILTLGITFDQLIIEHEASNEWVHIGICPHERKEVLRYDGTQYKKINK